VQSGRVVEHLQRVAAGEPVGQIMATLPMAPLFRECSALYERALELFERIGDRRGVMSTVIAMAYVNYAPVIHLTSSARHIEEIRRLSARMSSMTKESERAHAELQMLYGVQVYARAKIVPDLALARGEEAYRLARVQGDRSVEFAAAGGMALSHLELGELDDAERWLDRAAGAAAMSPTPLRARRLEMWRGMARAAAGDADAMRDHFARALKIATDQGRPAARCETVARLALEAARLGADRADEELLGTAEQASFEAKDVLAVLGGHPPWGAQADAAIALTSLARGDVARAATAGGAALQALHDALHEDANLDVVLPSARAVLAGGPEPMRETVRGLLGMHLSGVAQRTLEESVRVRWLRGPVGRELAELAGPLERLGEEATGERRSNDAVLGDGDRRLLHLLTEGRTNGEIGDEIGATEEDVARRLGRLFASIHASSRAEATAFAFREGVR
jgi:DNA-binding NarL/FixJ family response regulator